MQKRILEVVNGLVRSALDLVNEAAIGVKFWERKERDGGGITIDSPIEVALLDIGDATITKRLRAQGFSRIASVRSLIAASSRSLTMYT